MSVKGFEEFTYELRANELKFAVPILANTLSTALGKENTISSSQIVAILGERGFQTDDKRIRRMIQYLRRNKKVRGLIASHKGYYISQDPKEIREYANESYGSRIREMTAIMYEILDDAEYFSGI